MPRIRNVKPEFFTSESVAELPLRTRLTWIGLWTHSDNYGRSRDNVRTIKGAVWPLDDDVSLEDIEEDLQILAEKRRLVRYEVDGKRYLVITNWGEHQYGAFKDKPKHPGPVDNAAGGPESTYPPASREKSVDLLEVSGDGGEKFPGIQVSSVRDQGRGTRASTPPKICDRHKNDPNPPPCRGCASARQAFDRWESEQRAARADVVRACRLCDGDGRRWDPAGKSRGTVGPCDHRPLAAAS
jgi:hypothetical protein